VQREARSIEIIVSEGTSHAVANTIIAKASVYAIIEGLPIPHIISLDLL